MKYLYFILLFLIIIPSLILLTSFFKKNDGKECATSTNDVLDRLGDFSYPIGKKLAKRHNMKFSGADSVWKNHKPAVLSLGFQLWQKEPLNREMARKIIVDCIDEYVSAINNAELLLAQYLSHFPFSHKDVSITILCSDERGGDIYDPAISVMSAYRGQIYYSTDDPDHKYRYKSEFEETYEEAKEILKN